MVIGSGMYTNTIMNNGNDRRQHPLEAADVMRNNESHWSGLNSMQLLF